MHKYVLGKCLFVSIAGVVCGAAGAAPVLYTSDTLDNYVAVVDTATMATVGAPISVPQPLAPVVSADGSFVYVQSVDGSISVIDAQTRSVIKVFDNPNPTSSDGPASMTLSPDGNALYAISAVDGAIAVIDTDTGLVTARIPGPGNTDPSPLIRVTHDGRRLFVLGGASRTLTAIDIASKAVVGQVTVPGSSTDHLVGLVVAADDRTAFTTEYSGSLVSIDTSSMSVASTILIAHSPNAIDLSPDGSRVFIAETGDGCMADVVLSTEVPSATGLGDNVCFAVAAGPDGRHVFLGSYDIAHAAYSIFALDLGDYSVRESSQFTYVNFDNQSMSSAPVTPEPGTWWNPAESGRSFNIEVRHDTLVLVAQAYDSGGAPTWLLASGPYDAASGTFSGEFGSYSGGQCLGCPYRVPDFSPVSGGQVKVVFSTATSGMLYFGETSTPIQKFDW